MVMYLFTIVPIHVCMYLLVLMFTIVSVYYGANVPCTPQVVSSCSCVGLCLCQCICDDGSCIYIQAYGNFYLVVICLGCREVQVRPSKPLPLPKSKQDV